MDNKIKPKQISIKRVIDDQIERVRSAGLSPIGVVLSNDAYHQLLAALALRDGLEDPDPISAYESLPIHVIAGEAVAQVTIDAQAMWYEHETYDAAMSGDEPRRVEPRFMDIG